jgi:hypothetical protein
MLMKKIWANFQRNIEVFTQKIFNMLPNIWVWDPRSGTGKNLFRIPDPGVKKGTGSRIRNTAFYPSRIPESKIHHIPDPDPQHCPDTMPFLTLGTRFGIWGKLFQNPGM